MKPSKNNRIQLIDPVGKDKEFHDYQDMLLPTLDAIKPEPTTF